MRRDVEIENIDQVATLIVALRTGARRETAEAVARHTDATDESADARATMAEFHICWCGERLTLCARTRTWECPRAQAEPNWRWPLSVKKPKDQEEHVRSVPFEAVAPMRPAA